MSSESGPNLSADMVRHGVTEAADVAPSCDFAEFRRHGGRGAARADARVGVEDMVRVEQERAGKPVGWSRPGPSRRGGRVRSSAAAPSSRRSPTWRPTWRRRRHRPHAGSAAALAGAPRRWRGRPAHRFAEGTSGKLPAGERGWGTPLPRRSCAAARSPARCSPAWNREAKETESWGEARPSARSTSRPAPPAWRSRPCRGALPMLPGWMRAIRAYRRVAEPPAGGGRRRAGGPGAAPPAPDGDRAVTRGRRPPPATTRTPAARH